MKWILTSNKTGHKIYELWNSDEKLPVLTIHVRSGSLRLTTADEQRVFLVERQGFLRSRTVLRNEYGIRIGQLSSENGSDNTGILDFDNERFTYKIQQDFDQALSIAKNDEIVASCELPPNFNHNIHGKNRDLMVLGLSWYLIAYVKKHVEQFV